MSAAVRPLRRTQAPDGALLTADLADYCPCGRGPVIGVVTYTSSRMYFFPAGSRTGEDAEHAPELACLDCVADTAADVASGAVRDRMQAEAVELRTAQAALTRRSQISVADHPRQTSPSKGDRLV